MTEGKSDAKEAQVDIEALRNQTKEPMIEGARNKYEINVVVDDAGYITVGFKPGSVIDLPVTEIRDVLQKALTQINQDIITRVVVSSVKKLLSNGNIAKPGFRKGWFGRA